MIMELIILRHGKTVGNTENRYVGRTDEPLSNKYIDEVKAQGSDPEVLEVYVSPLIRTRQTAQILFPNAKQTVVKDLREMDFGDFEGRTGDEMVNDEAYLKWVDGSCEGLCPNGEDLNGFRNRVCRAFEQLTRDEIKDGNERLVIVAHGGTIMAVMSSFTEAKRPYFDWFVPNCHGWRSNVELRGPDSDIILTDSKYI